MDADGLGAVYTPVIQIYMPVDLSAIVHIPETVGNNRQIRGPNKMLSGERRLS
jgi:hypothetical protein